MLRGLLKQKHITIKTGCMLSEVKNGSLIVKTEKGNEEIQTEQTILAIGYRAKHTLFEKH